MPIVYSYYSLDIVHRGHLLMMENAKAMAGPDGRLVVGILTDEAVMEKKPRPTLPFEERIELARAIRYADLVVAQETYSPLPNVMDIRPDILMESTSHDKAELAEHYRVMERLGGRVISIPYFPNQSSTNIKNRIRAGD